MSLADDVLNAETGSVKKTAAINLPAGHLWANGAAVSRTAYARLFAAITLTVTGTTSIGSANVTAVSQDLTQLPTSMQGAPVSGPGIPAGTTIASVSSTAITLSQAATANASGVSILVAPYGIGDGSTTFNVPDLRGRVVVGHDLMGTTAAGRITSGGSGVNGALLGASGGVETVTLTTAQMPSHSHTATDSGHTHLTGQNAGVTNTSSNVGVVSDVANTNTTSGTGYANITVASQGGGGAHTNTQPSIVMNYIIKT